MSGRRAAVRTPARRLRIAAPGGEALGAFPCFGSTCTVAVTGAEPERAVAAARARLLAWHARFTRFDPASELSRLNADPREEVPVSADMARLVAAVIEAGRASGGLVDATLLGPLEAAGYRGDLGPPLPLATALALAPARAPGRAGANRWRELELDPARGVLRRPPGLELDGGGLAKGLFADLLAGELARHASFAVDCAGDLRLGGTGALARPVNVGAPSGEATLHVFALAAGGVATSGIGRRSWLDAGGRPAHHLLDPASGRPAYTGVVQATALAPTGVEAEWRAKAALLAGPAQAAAWLPHGGVLVLDDGTFEVLEASASQAPPRVLPAFRRQ